MTEKRTPDSPQRGNVGKDPLQGATGDEPMTGVQRSCLHTLAQKAGQPVDDSLTRAQANKRIEELHAITGRKLSTATSEEPERGDDGVLESLGRAISAPLLDAHDATPPQPPRSAGDDAGPHDPGSPRSAS